MASLHDRLLELLEPLVESLGYELVLLEFNAHKGSALVRLFIDAPAGVTLGDCEKVSREVEGKLDVSDPIPQNYRLEVSSPGLDRPLVKPAHFERFAGQVARVQLLAPQAPGSGRRKFQGVLRGLRGDNVVLETADAGTVELALGNIERARLVPDYELTGAAAPKRREKELSGS
jgi:ribosome maturation factor RimP